MWNIWCDAFTLRFYFVTVIDDFGKKLIIFIALHICFSKYSKEYKNPRTSLQPIQGFKILVNIGCIYLLASQGKYIIRTANTIDL